MSGNLTRVARLTGELARVADTDELFHTLLEGLERSFGIEHTLLMLVDESGDRLFTVASRGFVPSGVGSEQRVGEGFWGKVAERRAAIRIGNLGMELRYARRVRGAAERAGDERLTREIALPGLDALESLTAAPLVARRETWGVLGAQSPRQLAFSAADEAALSVLAVVTAQQLWMLRHDDAEEPGTPGGERIGSTTAPDRSIHVRYHASDDSVFVDHEYIAKGLPGRILYKLARAHAGGRRDFSNKELRLDADLKLSPLRDNLESRLILLRRRLEEKNCGLVLKKRGRGRFSFEARGSLVLEEG